MKPLVRSILPIKLIQAPWVLPSCLNHLARALEALPSGRTLLNSHTIYPSARPFLSSESRAIVETSMLDGQGGGGLYFRLGLNHSLVASHKMSQTFCRVCAEEDMATFGFSYWKRIHQFPYISTCGLHGEILQTGSGCCPVTAKNSRHASLPDRFCACPSPSVAVSSQRRNSKFLVRDRAISSLLVEALALDWPKFDISELSLLYRHVAIERGYAKGRYINTIALQSEIVRFYGEEFLQEYASLGAAETGWIAEAFRGGPPKSVVRNALLIHYLFENWDKFCLSMTGEGWRNVSLPSRRVATVKAAETNAATGATRRARRAELNAWRFAAKNPSRTSAQAEIATVVNWLRTHDTKWYEETMPAISRAGIGAAQAEAWSQKRAAAEKKAIEHVQRRYQLLLASDAEPVRITRPRLHQGLAKPFALLPKTLKVVDTLVDSRKSFNERRALWIFLHPERTPSGVTVLEYAYQKTRVPKGRILELAGANVHRERK